MSTGTKKCYGPSLSGCMYTASGEYSCGGSVTNGVANILQQQKTMNVSASASASASNPKYASASNPTKETASTALVASATSGYPGFDKGYENYGKV